MYGDVVCGDSTLLRRAGHMLLPIIPVSTQRISIVYISTSSTKIKISAQDFIAFLPLYNINKKESTVGVKLLSILFVIINALQMVLFHPLILIKS